MNILLTGGAGFIGSNLAKELNKNNTVTILDNLHTGSLNNINDIKHQISFIRESCNNINNTNITNDIDLIFHLGIPSSSPMYKTNPLLVGEAINGTINVFEFAKLHNIQKIIYSSSSSLYSGVTPPHKESRIIKVTDYYTEARFSIERIAKLYNLLHGIKSVGLRFFSVYGPNEQSKGKYANMISQFLWEMQKGNAPVIYGDGTQTRDFTYVNDIVNACTLIMKKPFNYNILNVGTGHAYSFNKIIEILNSKLKTKIKPIYIKIPMSNYVDHTLADITKIKRLGYTPKFNIFQGIDELIK